MPSPETLTDFLRKQHEEEQRHQVDWATVRREWLEDLETLGRKIADWLSEPAREGLLEIVPGEMELQEETLGRYVVQTWEIRAASRVISVVPVGRVIVGGQGRVDLRCGPRKRMVIRTGKGSWEIHDRGLEKGRELSRETFSETVRELLS